MTAPTSRMFGLGAILTVTTDRMLARDLGDIYELLNFMTGDNHCWNSIRSSPISPYPTWRTPTHTWRTWPVWRTPMTRSWP